MPPYIQLKNGKWKLLTIEESKQSGVPDRLKGQVRIHTDSEGNETFNIKLANISAPSVPDELDADEDDDGYFEWRVTMIAATIEHGGNVATLSLDGWKSNHREFQLLLEEIAPVVADYHPPFVTTIQKLEEAFPGVLIEWNPEWVELARKEAEELPDGTVF